VADGHQLCGGGRYDDLIEMLGGSQPQPATGFSFGLEWVCSALEAEGHSTDSDEPAAQVFVAAGDDAGLVRAVQVAEHVRALGWRAELGLSPHTTGDCLSYAQHRRIPLLITVTAQPETPITLYNTHTQQTVSTRLSDLAQVLHIMESPHE
jgi:histidyl-tRNA synthetase